MQTTSKGWVRDGSNEVLRDADDGLVIAIIDPSCGGYQNPTRTRYVAWKVIQRSPQNQTHIHGGIVPLTGIDFEAGLALARNRANAQIENLIPDLVIENEGIADEW